MINRTKAGVSFGIGMAVFLILRGFFFQNENTNEPLKIILAAVIAGALSGLLVGWLAGASSYKKKNKVQ